MDADFGGEISIHDNLKTLLYVAEAKVKKNTPYLKSAAPSKSSPSEDGNDQTFGQEYRYRKCSIVNAGTFISSQDLIFQVQTRVRRADGRKISSGHCDVQLGFQRDQDLFLSRPISFGLDARSS